MKLKLKKKELKNVFLELLRDDENFRNEISKYFAVSEDLQHESADSAEITKMQETIDALNDDIEAKQETIDALQNDIKAKREIIADLTKYKEDAEEKQNIIDGFNEKYGRLNEVYGEYKKLDDAVKKGFGGIINGDSPEKLLASGADYKGTELFFEKVCMDNEHYDGETLRILNIVFDYLFDMLCSYRTEYERIITETGDDFDDAVHTRTPKSPPVGKIGRVIISGYRIHGEVAKRSLVEIVKD